MTEENEALKFPDECPVCGSKDRLLAQTIAKLKEEGKLSKEVIQNGAVFQIPLIDPARVMKIVTPTIKIHTMLIVYDVCAACKTFYATGMQMIEMPAQMRAQQLPPAAGRDGPDYKGGRVGPF